jgi:hypothetical protein
MDTKWMPAVGGILNIVAGSISLVAGISCALVVAVFFSSSYDYYSGQEFPALSLWLMVFIPYVIISLLALTGGIFALKRKAWGLCLTASICSLLTLWGWVLGIAAIVFISLSKSEFKQNSPMFPESVIPPSPPPAERN